MYAAISPSEPPRPAPPALQRVDGVARVRVARSGLAGLYQRSPCRVLVPRGAGPEYVLLNTAGGLTGGDRLDVAFEVEAGAACVAATQAAERVYRSPGDEAAVRTRLRVAGELAWLPQETIVFDRARLDRAIDIDVVGDGRLLALDWLVLGRTAHGERLTSGSVRDCWTVRRDGRLVWCERFRLAGDIAAIAARQALLGGAVACATLIAVGHDDRLDEVRAWLAACRCRVAASLRDGVLICRFLARDAAELRRDVIDLLTRWRGVVPPRVWAC